MRSGYIPYTSSIASTSHLAQGSDVFWWVVYGLKQVLDPDRIVARGCYDPQQAKLQNETKTGG
jgi:hypothetical protein